MTRRESKMLKLTEYAKRLGISRQQAYNMYKNNTLPHSAQKISDRIILVDVPKNFGLNEEKEKRNVVYVRVSSTKQQDSLNHQKLRILEYCAKNSIQVDEIVEEISSGMNGKRKKLNSLLKNPKNTTIIVEHRERLSRINFELIESALNAQERQIIVIDNEEVEDDLIRDVTEVLTSFCARFYGQRSARLKAQQIIDEVKP